MPFVPINPATIEVGDPITKELFDLIKNNFEDHESRLQILSGGSGKISLMNEDIHIGVGGDLVGVLYYEVIQNCIITEAAIQLFEKAPATIGTLSIDIKKNTTTDPTGFNTVFSTPPSIDIATALDYQRTTGLINSAAQALAVGEILRLDITGLPEFLKKFRVDLLGEF